MTLIFLIAFPLCAVAAAQSESPSEMSDEKLKKVAKIYIEVFTIQQNYKPRIDAAGSPEEADELQQEANGQMVEVIEDEEDVTVQEYNDVISALNDDEELRNKLQALVNEIQEEES